MPTYRNAMIGSPEAGPEGRLPKRRVTVAGLWADWRLIVTFTVGTTARESLASCKALVDFIMEDFHGFGIEDLNTWGRYRDEVERVYECRIDCSIGPALGRAA